MGLGRVEISQVLEKNSGYSKISNMAAILVIVFNADAVYLRRMTTTALNIHYFIC